MAIGRDGPAPVYCRERPDYKLTLHGKGGPMKKPLQPDVCARKLAALASPERLRILEFLRDGPRSVTAIAAMLEQPLVNASHHLTVLRRAEIIAGARKG